MAGQNHLTHEVPADATIMCDGKTCGLDDLKAGDVVTVSLDQQGDQTVVTKIEAKTAGSEEQGPGVLSTEDLATLHQDGDLPCRATKRRSSAKRPAAACSSASGSC